MINKERIPILGLEVNKRSMEKAGGLFLLAGVLATLKEHPVIALGCFIAAVYTLERAQGPTQVIN